MKAYENQRYNCTPKIQTISQSFQSLNMLSLGVLVKKVLLNLYVPMLRAGFNLPTKSNSSLLYFQRFMRNSTTVLQTRKSSSLK